MNLSSFALLSFVLVTTAAAETNPWTPPITFETALNWYTDLSRLARLPEPGETCKQFSSYDRRSRYDPVKKQYLDWSANGDCGNFLRDEPAGKVLAEMKGPGCIVRLWSANPAGTLKLFFDGEEEPRFVVDYRKFIAGETPPFTAPLVGMQSRGANCYIPFPYAKSCKVVVENPGRLYYHVNYRTFPAGTPVRTFQWPLRPFEEEALTRLNETLKQCGPLPQTQRLLSRRVAVQETINPGQTIRLAHLRGRRAIVGISIARFDCETTAEERRVLRGLTLTASWDGEKTPSVRAPLGDFFGTAPGYNVYRSLPSGMTAKGVMYSRWFMPFQKSALVRLRNDGPRPVRVRAEIHHAAHDLLPTEMGYFHAKWRREYPNKVFDWPFLECTGRGRFVGVALTVWNPVRGWWGEGDEKVYVDGEKFPSTFGTGSEDYFGYAWCCPELFTHPFHNQPLCEGPGNGNYTSVNRWHIADDIPFQKSYRMTIENYGKDKDYACTTYWYAAQPQQDFFKAWAPKAALDLHKRWKPYRVKGALEGESLRRLQVHTTGLLKVQNLGGYYGGKWSGTRHLWFIPKQPGEWYELAVPVKKAGTYRLTGYFTKARDYGIGQLYWNGRKVGQPLDAFNSPNVVATGAVDLGAVHANQGDNVLRVEVIGKNPKSIGYMFGLDCLLLKPE